MDLFGSAKKDPAKEPDAEKPVLSQDLSEEAKFSGIYSIWLLFREQVDMPSAAAIMQQLQQRFGGVDIVSDTSAMRSFALLGHRVTYQGGQQVPSQLLITECNRKKNDLADAIARTQFWDLPNGAALLDGCPWQMMISDFMSRGLPPLERAKILADWVEVALTLLPSCTAVYFQPSGKLLTPDLLHNNPYQGALRFYYGGVNTRFFNIQGTDNMLVDTLGLYALGLPDVLYHFHTLDPNEVVHHANNVAIYQFENDAPIDSGHTVDGIEPTEQWMCQYERSLIQPARDVLDINPGRYAAGGRE